MKTILSALLFFFAIVSLSSCKKSNPVTPPGNLEIIPFKMGNTWTMQYTVYDTTGSVLGTLNDTATVISDTVVSGDTWYHASSKVSSSKIFFTNRSDGLWEMTRGSSVGPSLFYKYPASVGDSWSVQMDLTPTINKGTLISDSIPVTVPRGTYSCYEYQMTDNSQLVEVVYLCPNVGIAAVDVYLNTNSGRPYKQAHGELTSFALK